MAKNWRILVASKEHAGQTASTDYSIKAGLLTTEVFFEEPLASAGGRKRARETNGERGNVSHVD